MHLDDLVADREADAAAWLIGAALIEFLLDMRQVDRRDPRPVVGDDDGDKVAAPLDRDVDVYKRQVPRHGALFLPHGRPRDARLAGRRGAGLLTDKREAKEKANFMYRYDMHVHSAEGSACGRDCAADMVRAVSYTHLL